MSIRNVGSVGALRSVLLLLLWLAPTLVLGQSDVGTLRVAIRDQASGRVVPAMVCITPVPADGTWREPGYGLLPAPYVRNLNFIAARWRSIEYIAGDLKKWFPGDPGPSLLMNGPLLPAIYDHGGPAIPFWNEPAEYFVSKPFTITLLPGKWRLAVMRGFEYLPVYEEFTITPGVTLERDIQLKRWVNMEEQGWYPADPHVHSWRIAPSQDEFMMTWERAMNLYMLCVLDYGDPAGWGNALQARYGKAAQYHQGDHWLDSGLEDPRMGEADEGHIEQIDIQKPIRNPNKYELYSYVFDRVHAEGGLIILDHVSYAAQLPGVHPYGPPWCQDIWTILGGIDGYIILEDRNFGVKDYYDYLNMGVKLTAIGATDFPARPLGSDMTYAYAGTGGNFSADAWYAAVKRGRTFVTNGPMLTFTVGKAMPGDEVRVGKNAMLHIHAQAWAPESIGSPKVLEVVAEGRVIRSAQSHDPKQEKLAVDFELPASQSQWIAARTFAFNGAAAQTTPVYVIVNGQSFVDRADIKQLVAYRLKALDWIEKNRLENPRWTKHCGPGVVEGIRKQIELARAKYLALEETP